MPISSCFVVAGLTIIDSLDTLFLMGMKEEYNEAVEFVSNINYRWVGILIIILSSLK